MKRASAIMAGMFATALAGPAGAVDAVTSIYTQLAFDTDCVQLSADQMGGVFSCAGHGGYGVLLAEGDLRQTAFFGYVGDWYADGVWQSFSAFNQTNDTVEWRLRGGVPFATILRWFIENPNPETGAPDAAHRGEVLVVSKVGQPGEGDACVVGYVDALANAEANALARDVADTLAEGFACRTDLPQFHGERGPLTSEPTRVFEN